MLCYQNSNLHITMRNIIPIINYSSFGQKLSQVPCGAAWKNCTLKTVNMSLYAQWSFTLKNGKSSSSNDTNN